MHCSASSWTINVRRGVAEVTANSSDKVNATLELPREVWAQIVLKELSMDEAISTGKASVSGSKEDLAVVFGAFE